MKILTACLLFALPVLAAPQKERESAAALVDRLIVTPGEFDQICDAPPPLDPKIPLPIYKLVADRDVHLSKENIDELRQRRDEVVAELVKRLEAYDFSKPPKVYAAKRKYKEDLVEVSGISPHQISGLVYEMVLGLDAVETLPALLKLEEKLRALLEAADTNPKAPLPSFFMDGYVTMPSGKKELSKRDQALSRGRVVQRELLSVMLQLLRSQRYAPLLSSDIEKTYEKAIKARAQQDDLKDFKTPADAKAKGEDWIQFDPIHNVPMSYMRDYPSLVFGAEVRNQIRGMVENFLKDVPKDQWKKSWVQ